MAIHARSRTDVNDAEGAKEGASREYRYDEPTDADRLRDLLTKAGLSQRSAAKELEVDERTVRYWCSGQVKPPKMAFLALEHFCEAQRRVE